jgi:hypothetical protein
MNNISSLISETTSDVEHRPPPGQVAVVLMSLVIGILLMGIQLWLLTVALNLYLAGRGTFLWLIGIISGLVFLGGLLILRMLDRRPRSLRQLPEGR